MKKLTLLILTLTLYSCGSNDNSKEEEAKYLSKDEEKESNEPNKILSIEDSEIRLESIRRSETLIMYPKIKFSSDLGKIIFATVNIKYKDKYDKVWFDETIKIKDTDCSFDGWCNDLQYEIPYYKNCHRLIIDGDKDIETFDIIIMNHPDFAKYREKDEYNGKPMNKNVNDDQGFERVLIPDAIVTVIDVKYE